VVLKSLIVVLAGVAASAQAPVVGDIEFYGLRTVTADRILAATKLKPGTRIPPSKGDLQDTIADLPGVVLSRVEAVCCQGSNVTLFIGIEEKGAPHPAFRSSPSGEATLPAELIDAYQLFLTAVQKAATRGAGAEDLTAGHSLMDDPQARAYQERFVEFATANLPALRAALQNAPDPDLRALAAAVIGYTPNKQEVLNDLQTAVQDPDDSVRVNAIRSLNAFAVSGIKVAPTWFVELLNSVVLSDRVESVKALLTLTDKPAPTVTDLLRSRALSSLVEMARWKNPRYALPPFLLLARVAGIADAVAQQRWQKGDRESVIEKALPAPSGKKRPAVQ
jgi:hypothetical protein